MNPYYQDDAVTLYVGHVVDVLQELPGTVSLVAKKMGLASIYIDLHPEYAEIARKRIERVTFRMIGA